MSTQPTPFQSARAEALPYAKAIVAAQQHPARFNQADIWHAVGLEVGAIASTAIAQRRTVIEVVRRHYPAMVSDLATTISSLATLSMARREDGLDQREAA